MANLQDDQALAGLLDRIAEVCPVPAAAQRVIVLCSQDEADVGDVAEALAADAALAAEALRIANSAIFRRGRPVDTLGQAVLTLGLKQIHQMASAMALLAAFRSEHELSLQFHGSSVLAGTLAGLLAAEIGVQERGAAFLCGLLSEVGAMACVAVDDAEFVKIWREAAGSWDRRAELETRRYTVPSWEIGARLLARNELPEHVCRAVGAHFQPPLAASEGLGRVTVFGRMAAPELLALPPGQGMDARLGEIAALVQLDRVAPERLAQLAERALAAVERSRSKAN